MSRSSHRWCAAFETIISFFIYWIVLQLAREAIGANSLRMDIVPLSSPAYESILASTTINDLLGNIEPFDTTFYRYPPQLPTVHNRPPAPPPSIPYLTAPATFDPLTLHITLPTLPPVAHVPHAHPSSNSSATTVRMPPPIVKLPHIKITPPSAPSTPTPRTPVSASEGVGAIWISDRLQTNPFTGEPEAVHRRPSMPTTVTSQDQEPSPVGGDRIHTIAHQATAFLQAGLRIGVSFVRSCIPQWRIKKDEIVVEEYEMQSMQCNCVQCTNPELGYQISQHLTIKMNDSAGDMEEGLW